MCIYPHVETRVWVLALVPVPKLQIFVPGSFQALAVHQNCWGLSVFPKSTSGIVVKSREIITASFSKKCSPCRSGDSNQCSLVLRNLYGRAWQMCSFIYLYKGVKHLIYRPRYTHFLQWNPSYVVIKHFCCTMQDIWQLNNKLYCPQWTGTINFTWNLIIILPQAFPCVYTKHKASF